ncbi:hypothetical protein [uncultured Fusobacterium sp.]|uniref:hypothetical protein n=1 Tax=uncultured Fusobacterium sp. TaxID=159267 RepID=UPI0025F1ABB1|nr:hypothetical protein [uncultured Fusobacterium sp.]
MENILLVEPAYKNKYPPLGLMKISTFHKEYRKDYVKFVKGIKKSNEIKEKWDRIYITTLFTFDYDIVVKTINYYKNFVVDPQKDIIIGGILASLLSDKIEKATGIKPFFGQVTCASEIGYNDFKGVNVDVLSLDYDILSEIDYEYSAGDNYFGYTSRGCPNKCSFCAVPVLEPKFETTNNIFKQITEINEKYGEKRNLLLMDNNILYSKNLLEIVDSLNSLGFGHGQKTYLKPIEYENYYKRILRREEISRSAYEDVIVKDVLRIEKTLRGQVKNLKKEDRFKEIVEQICNLESIFEKLDKIKENHDFLLDILKKHQKKIKLVRYIDFNQGTDARLLTEEKMKILSNIPVKPYRIAFDDIKLKDIYIKAMKLASKYGVKHFSNYLLFNFQDKPEELWERIKINIDLAEEINATDLFSFPMKYSPIEMTHRKMIGENWTKKEISNIYAILNAKKGIIPKKKEYFEIAFGKNKEEFKKLLAYPRDFIIFRNFFKEIGYTQRWENMYEKLSEEEKKLYILEQSGERIEESVMEKMRELIFMSKIKKEKIEFIQKVLKDLNKEYSYDKIYNYLKEIDEKQIIKKKDVKLFLENNNFHQKIKFQKQQIKFAHF